MCEAEVRQELTDEADPLPVDDDDDDENGGKGEEIEIDNAQEGGENSASKATTEGACAKDESARLKSVYLCKSGAPKLVIPGHTGYLTFATLFPEFTTW